MVTLLIARHGQSNSNLVRIFTGQGETPLTPTGIKQGELLSDYILQNYKIDAIYSSSLSRAVNTIKKVSDTLKMPVCTCNDLREIYGGEWEDKKFADLEIEYAEDYALWKSNFGLSRCTGGESPSDVKVRAVRAINKIVQENEDKTVLIATHAAVIRVLQGYFCSLKDEELKDLPYVPNASLTKVVYKNGLFSSEFFGEVCYLNGLNTQLPPNV